MKTMLQIKRKNIKLAVVTVSGESAVRSAIILSKTF